MRRAPTPGMILGEALGVTSWGRADAELATCTSGLTRNVLPSTVYRHKFKANEYDGTLELC